MNYPLPLRLPDFSDIHSFDLVKSPVIEEKEYVPLEPILHDLSLSMSQLRWFPRFFGRFRDLRFVRTAELLAGKLPLQPHEYRDVIQKHCTEARHILLNKSVSDPRVRLPHRVGNTENSLSWTLTPSQGIHSLLISNWHLSLSSSFQCPSFPAFVSLPPHSTEILKALLGYRTVQLNDVFRWPK